MDAIEKKELGERTSRVRGVAESEPRGWPSPLLGTTHVSICLLSDSLVLIPILSWANSHQTSSSTALLNLPLYDHHSFLETQGKWVLIKEQQTGELGRIRAIPQWQDSTRERWRSEKLKCQFPPCLRAKSYQKHRGLGLTSQFQLLACDYIHHLLLDSLRLSSTTQSCDFQLDLPSAVPAWHATCYLLPGLSDILFCLLDWTSL